jgi:hypothetical protein
MICRGSNAPNGIKVAAFFIANWLLVNKVDFQERKRASLAATGSHPN